MNYSCPLYCLRYDKDSKSLIYIGIFVISLCIFFLGFLMRYYKLELFSLYGLPLSFLVMSVLYFILTVFLLRKYRGRLSSIGDNIGIHRYPVAYNGFQWYFSIFPGIFSPIVGCRFGMLICVITKVVCQNYFNGYSWGIICLVCL